MKKYWLFFFSCKCLMASQIFDTVTDLNTYIIDSEDFYEVYLAEQRNIDSTVDLATPVAVPNPIPPGPPGPSPSPSPSPSPGTCPAPQPSNPSAPAFRTGYLPYVIVNDSGYPDDQVFILITGKDPTLTWGLINSNNGEVTYQVQQTSDNSSNFSVKLSTLPGSKSGRVVYTPNVVSSLVYFSLGQALSYPGQSQPSAVNPSLQPYSVIWDQWEINFAPDIHGNTTIFVDATAVSAFAIPIYLYLAGATTPNSTSGLYQCRRDIFSTCASIFNSVTENSQWKQLILSNGTRILSPMQSMSTAAFDSNYLDNFAAYTYSYLSSIWYGAGAYYQTHPCNMTVLVTNPSTQTFNYVGNASSTTFTFTTPNPPIGPTVTFLAPVNGSSYQLNTSFLIFAAQNLTVPGGAAQPVAGTAADAVSKLFEEAVIAGLVPTTETLSLDYLTNNKANFYWANGTTPNGNLSPTGQTTGPWYDVYSQALHSIGRIYTYGFDEPLHNDVQIAGPFVDGSSYVGITIGNCLP